MKSTMTEFVQVDWLVKQLKKARTKFVPPTEVEVESEDSKDDDEVKVSNLLFRCKQLIQLYEILVKAPGVYGARFSGAGFHGCCIAFVDADCADEAASFVRNEYLKFQPKLASQINSEKAVQICDASDCARVI
ncbi:hypothetical protein Vadar_017033 [Vaccinium darrowii]|uniref:Uncharacterized protein n=1 Tax=Vaccinium darrowii TaxID=229202 RepID=A0ACB7YW44_9ERIC|nr:hypothetical protein Vadar_017033 [Vaccinium darrowii]